MSWMEYSICHMVEVSLDVSGYCQFSRVGIILIFDTEEQVFEFVTAHQHRPLADATEVFTSRTSPKRHATCVSVRCRHRTGAFVTVTFPLTPLVYKGGLVSLYSFSSRDLTHYPDDLTPTTRFPQDFADRTHVLIPVLPESYPWRPHSPFKARMGILTFKSHPATHNLPSLPFPRSTWTMPQNCASRDVDHASVRSCVARISCRLDAHIVAN